MVGVLLTLLMAVVLFHFVTISDAYPANAIVNGLITALLAYSGICRAGPGDAHLCWERWGVGDKAQTPWHQYGRSTRIARSRWAS